MRKTIQEINIETILKLRKECLTYLEISNWVGYSVSHIRSICQNGDA